LDGWYAGGPSDYLVVNQTKQHAFRWGWRYRRAGLTQFWVPSRYAEVVNRGWQHDRWALCQSLTSGSRQAT
jgi:hypothetical protein